MKGHSSSPLKPLAIAAMSAALLCMPAATVRGATSFDHEHDAWTRVLRAYVYDGNVSYTELRGDVKELDAYLAALSSVTRADYAAWNDRQRLAYWINAYNAFTMKLVVDNFPVAGIRSIGVLPGSALKKEFIAIRVLKDSQLSLDEIEHQVLSSFKDPRVHFALVPAARGAPRLRTTAYRADSLDSQLEDAAYRFVNDPARNGIDIDRGTLKLSPVFKVFRKDFEAQYGTLPGFLALYADGDARSLKAPGRNFRIEFSEFDWSLNGR